MLDKTQAVPRYVLEDQWLKLYSEFCVISEDESVKLYVKEYGDLCVLESKVLRVKTHLWLIANYYDENAIKWLVKLGYKYDFAPDDYLDDVESVMRTLRNEELKIKTIKNAIKERHDQAKRKRQGINAYSNFDETISSIERVFKVPINTQTLTAQMFAIKIKELKEYSKKLAEQKQQK